MDKDIIKEIKQIIQASDLLLYIDLNLSDDLLIQEFQDTVDWSCVSRYQKISEQFIEKFQDKVDWGDICTYQKLSEDFIEKFKDKINWEHISIHQTLSEEFILKHWHKLVHNLIIQSQKSLTPAFLYWLYRTY